MKKLIIFLFMIPFIYGCDGGNFNNNNPFIPNYSFSYEINLSLPQYSNLQFASNSVRILDSGAGARGIIVFNTGSGYNAFDAACPNQALSSCSTMTVNGINATCPCDNAQYSLFTGQSAGLQYPMKQYRVQINGNLLIVYN